LGVLILLFTIPFGIVIMCIGLAVGSFLSLYVNSFYTKKILYIGFIQQIKEVSPSFLLAFIMGGVTWSLTKINMPDVITLLCGIVMGLLLYLCGSIIFKLKPWTEVSGLTVEYIQKFTKSK
jgi:uncharacterized protein YybS (DUF2232 family)